MYVFDVTREPSNPTVFIGTGGHDVFTFTTDGTNHHVSVTLEGQPTQNYTYDAATGPWSLTFNGLGGNDTITITGGHGTDTAFIGQTGKGTVKVVGTGYTLSGSNMETVSVQAGAGTSQVAKLWDTVGNDVFAARYHEATMTDAAASYTYSVSGFDSIFAYKTNLGTDEARFYDSPGDDTFTVKAYASQGSMSGRASTTMPPASPGTTATRRPAAAISAPLRLQRRRCLQSLGQPRRPDHTATIDAFSYGFAWNYGYSTAGGAKAAA